MLLQTYARLISTYDEEDITLDMAELEEAKQTIEPQALEAQSKLRSLKTDLQVWATLAEIMSCPWLHFASA